jgi:branched-chain amino acid transport system permease protein
MRTLARLGVAAFGAVVTVPWMNDSLLRLLFDVWMVAALALSWNFIGGIAGYPSFATAGFFGLGAYAVALAMLHGAAFPVALGAAAVLAGSTAAVLGLGILRLRGHYFAIATFGFAEALRELLTTLAFAGGGTGLNLPVFPGGQRAFTVYFYAAMLLVLLLAVVATVAVLRSPLGYGLRAIRDDEDGAEANGVNTRALKALAFTLSGFFAGLPGGIYAYRAAYIEPSDVFDVLFSIKPIIAAIVGGTGTVGGPILGAAVFEGLKDMVWGRSLEFHNVFLGVLVVLIVVFAPRGLVDLGRQWRRMGTLAGAVRVLSANVRQHRV